MAEQIKRKVPIQWIQTIKDDGTYEFNPDPNVYSTQKNVPSTNKIDFQSILIDGTNPTNPLSASYATSASYALTASYLNTLNQNLTFNGNLTLNGTASISYLNVAYESASVIYSSGSNQFGDASNDTQTLYGSVIIPTGSLTVTGSLIAPSITGSLLGTASFAVSASRAVSSSFALTSSFTPNAIVTASVSSNTITFTKGNGTTFPITVNTGSGGGGATSPGGSTTEIQYNNAGAFAGTSTLTFDGTTITANPISATGYFIPANALGGLTTVGVDYTIAGPGVYRFTLMDTGGAKYISFPDPSSLDDGQIIIIINSDATYAGYYNPTYSPEDALGNAITVIGAGTVDTFVNMEGIWIRTARRP
jgi:hypothetical protein